LYPKNVEKVNTELASLEKAESELMEIEREIDSAKKVSFLYSCAMLTRVIISIII
jgi:prefoldin subunit 5